MKLLKCITIILTVFAFKFANCQSNNDEKIQAIFSANKVKSIHFNIAHKSYAANACMNARIIITTIKDKEITVEGKDCLKHFSISVIGASFDSMGVIKIQNIKSLIKYSIIVTAVSKYNQSYKTTDTIRINFKDTLKLSYNGINGKTGESGKYGGDGIKVGNKASNGGNGLDGKNGEDGAHGQIINITATLFFDSIFQRNLLNISITSCKTLLTDNYLMDPDSGFAIITSNGGNGGQGGRGGDGGIGVDGLCRKGYIGYGTSGEFGGKGGNGGNGGMGGQINFFFDSLCVKYINQFALFNEGGHGGKGGESGNRGGHGQNYYNGEPRSNQSTLYKFDPGTNGADGTKGPEIVLKIEKITE